MRGPHFGTRLTALLTLLGGCASAADARDPARERDHQQDDDGTDDSAEPADDLDEPRVDEADAGDEAPGAPDQAVKPDTDTQELDAGTPGAPDDPPPPPLAERVRLLVTTDIENEPDDQQSLVRLLCYANEFDIEGLVATTSTWLRSRVAPGKIREVVSAYGKVRDKLLQHAPGFPGQDQLLQRVKAHLPLLGMAGVGPGKDSEGSNHIIDVVDRPDSRPVWITIWGGANAVAQALHKVRATRSQQQLAAFVKKLRVYAISDQDDSGPWLRKEFPGLFYIVSPTRWDNDSGYRTSTWTGISGETFFKFGGPDPALVSNAWVMKHVHGHGPLGDSYPLSKYIMEGDTPSWLYLVPNGLGVPERPDFGSWGGRYVRKDGIWTNAADTVVGIDGKTYTQDQATIWRWRSGYQNDFEARLDWQIKGPKDANHPPAPRVSGTLVRKAKPGERVTLDASASNDPDGDKLAFEWSVYPEAGTFRGQVSIANASAAQATLTAPQVNAAATIHVILTVTDAGSPSLRRYSRVIVEVVP